MTIFEKFVAFARARFGAIRGLALLGAGAVLALALFSYDPSDASLNTTLNAVTQTDTQNWLGTSGARLADLALQIFGLGAWGVVALMPIAGYRAWRRDALAHQKKWRTYICAVLGVCTLALAHALWPLPTQISGPQAGGIIGQFLSAKLPIATQDGAIGLSLLAFMVALASLAWIYGLRFYHLRRGLHYLRNPMRPRVVAFFKKINLRKTTSPAPEPSKTATKQAKVKAKPAPPKASRRATREAQANLGFEAEKNYQPPALHYLAQPRTQAVRNRISPDALQANARLLETVLSDFGIKGTIGTVRPGPVVTLYELEPAAGIRSARIVGLADDIARAMSAIACRVAPVPGSSVIGIELPNATREMVYLRELLSNDGFESDALSLPLAVGKDIGGAPIFTDLAKMPHLLVAGTTGSGKSVGINTMILSLLYRLSPAACRLILIDPKMLELSVYDDIPHLLAPVVTEPKRAVIALKWVVQEMENRYRKMAKIGVRNIGGYNARMADAVEKGEALTRDVQTGFDAESGEAQFEQESIAPEQLPFIVVVIDEMADLMLVAGKDIEAAVQRLAQMARAAGIHLITATQRPSVDVITGTIKANFPCRISFQVTSKIDSRTVLGEQGGEQLLGQGDMLLRGGGGRLQRIHGAFVSDDEVERVVTHLKKYAKPDYIEAVTEEPPEDAGDAISTAEASLYDQAVALVARDGRASTSYIQRRLKIGYNRAASLIEEMEEQGIVSPPNHAGKREILVDKQ